MTLTSDIKNIFLTLTLTILLALASTLVFAALYVNTDETLLYDSTLDITWVLDGNYAVTSEYVLESRRYDKRGYMTWPNAEAWVGTLTLEDATSWRQGTLTELETLYSVYIESNVHASVVTLNDGSTLKIPNIVDFSYWSSESETADLKWSFSFASGTSSSLPRNSARLVWPVHDGDVGFLISVTWQGQQATWQGDSVTWQ